MIFFYGVKDVQIKTKKSESSICPDCESKGTLNFWILRKHFHFFWIPMFPLWKKGVCECSDCGSVYKARKLKDDAKKEYNEIKSNSRGPLWQFTGTGIIILLIALSFVLSTDDSKEELLLLNSPQIGDVYILELGSSRYSTLKVVESTIDSVFVATNIYETNKVLKVYSINKKENYSDFSYGLSKKEILNMHSKDEIFDVVRK